MRIISKNLKQDPIKSAIYHPKEFRGWRRPFAGPDYRRDTGFCWRQILFFAVAGVIGWYLWDEYVQAATAGRAFSPISVSAPVPATGTVTRLRQEPPGSIYAPLKLFGNRNGKHCVFRLEDWQTGVPVLTVFVRAGELTETMVALGQYRGKIVCGSASYGAQPFGTTTTADQLVAPVVFKRNTAGIPTGMVIDLTPRLGGNLQTATSKENNLPYQKYGRL